MAKAKKSETVPQPMQEKYDRITTLTDAFAQKHLNEEYAQYIRYATAALCRKRPSPLASGKEATWACGITHAIGAINFLFDSTQTPHIPATELFKAFGVAASTGQAKSKTVRDSLNMSQLDPDWSLPSKLGNNPMAWLISVNGFILDARSAPREVQETALAKGLIPYIPDAQGNPITTEPTPTKQSSPKSTRKKAANKNTNNSPNALYTLDVYIIDGPLTEKFVKKNPVVCRTIAIQGNHTLADLHRCIFQAFDREEEHMYEFQLSGEGPNDPKARRYGLPMASSGVLGKKTQGDVTTTTIASLGLTEDEAFGYWFDFGDDWWHQINIVAIAPEAPQGNYPKVTKRVGASPPQYADFD